jgi:hypothetical protein
VTAGGAPAITRFGRFLHASPIILGRRTRPSGRAHSAFCRFAIATRNLESPPIECHGCDQSEGINHDYGVFDDPDAFYETHGANLSGIRRLLFKHVVRKWMNGNIARIRSGNWHA